MSVTNVILRVNFDNFCVSMEAVYVCMILDIRMSRQRLKIDLSTYSVAWRIICILHSPWSVHGFMKVRIVSFFSF